MKEFCGDVKVKMLDLPLEKGDIPEEHVIQKKFMVVEEYFKEGQLPLILKKLAGETEFNYRQRVKMFLLACSDDYFTNIANLINPENIFQQGFFELYTEVTVQRVQQKQESPLRVSKKASEPHNLKCSIF